MARLGGSCNISSQKLELGHALLAAVTTAMDTQTPENANKEAAFAHFYLLKACDELIIV